MGKAFIAAAVQAAYVLMDRDKSAEKVVEPIGEAARQGAELIVFPEAFVPERRSGSTRFPSGTATRSGSPGWSTRRWSSRARRRNGSATPLGRPARTSSSVSTSASPTGRRSTTPSCTSDPTAG